MIATDGTAFGQVQAAVTALSVDKVGNLYVADSNFGVGSYDRGQLRDAQGHWSLIAAQGSGAGHLAVDPSGDLYVADGNGIQKRDTRGSWSVLDTDPNLTGPLAVDAVGCLYVARGQVWEYIASGGR